MEWNATLKNLRISPRKTRLVVDAVRGKSVREAILILDTVYKKSSLPVKKLIQSAVANAKTQDSVLESQLKIDKIFVDAGMTLKRFRPRAFGRAYTIRKRSSHISLTLTELDIVKNRKLKTEKSEEKLVKEVITAKSDIKSSKPRATKKTATAKKSGTSKATKKIVSDK
ncbi:50S ribosomal protein L22 [bacterium]|nr:50S ribosomal protein L22 [Candidatus Elulimicrobium humile]